MSLPDFAVGYDPGHPLYALVLNPVDGTAWNSSTGAWADRDLHRASCALVLTDDGAGIYAGAFPANLPPGSYLVQSYYRAGAVAVETDPLTGTAEGVDWLGPGGGPTPPEPDFGVAYPPGFTVYALVLTDTGLAWDGAAFAPVVGNRPACAVPMVYNATTGRYEGFIPEGLPEGVYRVESSLQLGATPGDDDPVIGYEYLSWGSGEAAATAALFEKALVTDLKLNTVLAGLVGVRIFPGHAPQGAPLPRLVYEVTAKGHEKHLDGPNGIARARVLVHCQSASMLDAKACAEQMRWRYDGFQGYLGQVAIVESWLDDDPDDFDPAADGSDDGTYSCPCAFLFRYRESIPPR